MPDLSPALRAVPDAPPAPRVSVIMPFLDAMLFIDEAIASVLGQTLADWELLLVDDGSTDESRDIAARYAAGDPGRIRLLSHPARENRGIAASRNLGMSEARGRYIAFLDADDVFEPRRLEHHVNLLDAEPGLGLVIGADLYWYNWGPDGARASGQPDRVIGSAAAPNRRYEPPSLLLATLLTRGAQMPAVCGVTFRRMAFAKLGPTPAEFRAHYEDQVLFCKLLLEYPAWVSGQALARYRQRPGSVTEGNDSMYSRPGSPAMWARERFLCWLDQYLRDTSRDLPELRSWIESELIRIRASLPRDGQRPPPRPLRKQWMSAARRLLPAWLVRPLIASMHAVSGQVARWRAMRFIRRYEAGRPGR